MDGLVSTGFLNPIAILNRLW